jgi:formylglycine-generating enzyme required for sulfatase activity
MMKRLPRLLLVALLFSAGFHLGRAQVTNSLSIANGGGQTVLFWPASLTNFVVQRASSPNSATWVTVTNAVAVTAVSLPAALSAGYYRLYMNTNIPAGTVIIPAGLYEMGNTVGDADIASYGDSSPVSVTVSNFYMDANLVSYGQWQLVYNWATAHGYGFVDAGSGKGTNYPVDAVDWCDAVKWSNARSQQAGLTPVYFTDAGLTQVYTNGEMAPYANWTAKGYRLPTEAEWEKTARGGASGQRFPWGNTIS